MPDLQPRVPGGWLEWINTSLFLNQADQITRASAAKNRQGHGVHINSTKNALRVRILTFLSNGPSAFPAFETSIFVMITKQRDE